MFALVASVELCLHGTGLNLPSTYCFSIGFFSPLLDHFIRYVPVDLSWLLATNKDRGKKTRIYITHCRYNNNVERGTQFKPEYKKCSGGHTITRLQNLPHNIKTNEESPHHD
jgi:hypothetical protein